jgi:hypothetical protein
MNRPLLSLSIVDLIEKFDAANGDVAVALELVKELRHRNTPKAVVLNKRVLEVLAINASGRLFQSLLLPELEILYASFLEMTDVRSSLISVLETRNSGKSKELLDLLKAQSVPSLPTGERGVIGNFQASVQPGPALLASRGVDSDEEVAVPPDVRQAFNFFALPFDASWSDVEAARRAQVFRYRPGSGVAVETAQKALTEISSSYLLLAKHMQARH